MRDPTWLTEALHRGGGLTAGAVAAATVHSWQDTALSAFDVIELSYTPDATGPRPARVLAKRVRKAFSGVGAREERFFAATRGLDLPAVRAHGWGRHPETRVPVVLLDDLRPTHRDVSTPWPFTPPPDEVAAALSALARVHAVGPAAADLPRAELPSRWTRAWLARARTCLPAFLDRHGPLPGLRDPDAWLAALPAALDALHQDRSRWTLLHGDAHHWNALHPRLPEDGGAVWIDWQLWRVGLPAFDVAWMLAVNSEPAWRARHEDELVRHYLGERRARGARVDLARFEREVRVAVRFLLTVPVTLSSSDVPEALWRGMVRRGTAALG